MYISIDVGATNIGITGSKSTKEPEFEFSTKIKTMDSYEEDIDNIARELTRVSSIDGIAIGIPGIMNEERTSARVAENLKSWAGRNLKADFEEKFGCKVLVENDAALAALGEGTYGGGKNKDFIFIIWGTGVGGTRIHNEGGKIDYSPFEPGHDFVIEEDGREGSCGHKGDIESYVGGRSVKIHYGKPAVDLLPKEWNEVISYFSQGIKKVLETYPSDLIILGGGVAIGQPDKVARIEREVQENFPSVSIITSALGEKAALYGGFALLETELS